MCAFQRFMSRRGIPNKVFSDNAKTFVSASRRLKELYELFQSTDFKQRLHNFSLNHRIEWRFIPPYSPHHGGLWEGNIKMMKYHMKRIIGNAMLTYDQFVTVLTRIEACLNSRPLSPISSDPNDLSPLTPGHFILGQSLTALPAPSQLHIPSNRLSTYQYLLKLTEHFWTRWKREYLLQLQHRNKWRQKTKNVEVGQLVLLKSTSTQPLVWDLGRIVKVYPGEDGFIRVVDVFTNRGIQKRSINHIYLLPQG